MKAEYLKGSASAPVYLTVWPGGAKSSSGVLTLVDKTLTGVWKQRPIVGESATRFSQAFGREMGVVGGGVAVAPTAARQAATPVADDDPRALRDALAASGWSAGVLVQPIAPDDTRRVLRFHWAYNIVLALCLGLGLGAAIAGLVAGVGEDDSGMTPLQIVLVTVFVVGLFGGMLALMVFWPIRYALLKREFAARPGSPVTTMSPRQVYRVHFAKEFHLKEKTVEDIAVVGVNDQRQLVIEGVRYRYVIPAAAVKQISPVQSDVTVAIQVIFDANGRAMQLMLSRDNMKGYWQQQIPMISADKDAGKAVEQLRSRLEFAPAEEAGV